MTLQTDADRALLELLQYLRVQNYRFVTPTPDTHRLVIAREGHQRARTVRDILGWSLPFDPTEFAEIAAWLAAANCLQQTPAGHRSAVRISTLGAHRFLHSAFPTTNDNAVFFGPDTYRFAAFVQRHLPATLPAGAIVDIGAGSGAGGIVAVSHFPNTPLILSDLNPEALRLSRINAVHAGIAAEFIEASGAQGVANPIALAVANPPFIAGENQPLYRGGGDMHGSRLSLDWATQAIAKLVPMGRCILYTGVAIIEGTYPLYDALAKVAATNHCTMHHEEIDPDIFGSELASNAYAQVERMAAVGFVFTKNQ